MRQNKAQQNISNNQILRANNYITQRNRERVIELFSCTSPRPPNLYFETSSTQEEVYEYRSQADRGMCIEHQKIPIKPKQSGLKAKNINYFRFFVSSICREAFCQNENTRNQRKYRRSSRRCKQKLNEPQPAELMSGGGEGRELA